MSSRRANTVRIIAGEWRSRLITFPAEAGLRPTPDRVRETLFNWLGQDLAGMRCLDLFGGSGALAFEALSRGAQEVVLVERSAAVVRSLGADAEGPRGARSRGAQEVVLVGPSAGVVRSLAANAKRLGAQRLRLVSGDALEFAATAQGQFDVVFVDPPYGSGLAEAVLPKL